MRSARVLAMAVGLVAAGVGAGAAFAAEPVALLVKIEGEVQVHRAGEGASVPAEVGMALAAGDRVVPATGARAVLLHSTGRTEVAAESVTLAEPERGQRAGVFTRAVRTMESVAATSAKTDPNRQGMIRPVPGSPVPVAPRNGLAVLAPRPVFVWLSVPGATSYTIQLRAEGQRPVRYEVGADTTWTLPVSAEPLRPGVRYQWTVGATGTNARVAEPQTFRVVDDAVASEVNRALAELAGQGFGPQGDGAFLAALVFHGAGLPYEADRVLARLERRGEGGGRLFHLLRGEVHDALGRLEAAAHEFALADASSGA